MTNKLFNHNKAEFLYFQNKINNSTFLQAWFWALSIGVQVKDLTKVEYEVWISQENIFLVIAQF